MKKFLLLCSFILTSYAAFSAASVSQKEWRWRKDTGSETDASWAADQNEAINKDICIASNENVRLRMAFLIQYDGGWPSYSATLSTGYRLSYSISPEGPFTLMRGESGEAFTLAASTDVNNATATTQQLASGSESFRPGRIIDKATSTGITFESGVSSNSLTEHEWVLVPTKYVQAATYYFKLEGLNNYSAPLPEITITLAVSGSAEIKNVSCHEDSDGEIDLTVSGSAEPFTHNWSTGADTEDLTDLEAGNYEVTITDAEGCMSAVIANVARPYVIEINVDDIQIACAGSNEGAVHVSAQGGTGDLTYSWPSLEQSSQFVTNLAPGTYTVIVTDANECEASRDVQIAEEAPSASTEIKNVSCHEGSNGEIDLTVSGGTRPYTYNWSTGADTEDLTGLEAGSYEVTITSAKGCIVTVTADITQPDAIAVFIEQDIVACIGSNGGSAYVEAEGGTGALRYSWSSLEESSDIVANLAPGTYTVTVTDDNECDASADVEIVEDVCTGIAASSEISMNVNVYPNPSHKNGTVSISVPSNVTIEKVTLSDTRQRKIASASNAQQLALSNLETGMYIMEIVTNNGIVIKKLMVE